MGSIKRGDVYLVNFDPALGAEAKKTRPAVIVSNDINNAYSPIISIAPITSKITKIYSFEVEIAAHEGGLKTKSKIMINQTRAVDRERLVRKIGKLKEHTMKKVDNALKLHYDLP